MARSIKDEEIGIIKAMLERGERNVDIKFYFNRQDRPVNSGRISQIKNGTYGPNVPQADERKLRDFLRKFKSTQVGATISGNGTDARKSTFAKRASSRFEKRKDGHWYLIDGETIEQECKQGFEANVRSSMQSIIKAIAALANNKGGFIFLGVEDGQCRVTGLPDDAFQNIDVVQITQNVKNFLTPTPNFKKEVINVGDMTVGVIYVEKYDQPPVIVIRDGERLESGTILFRSVGQSAKISFGDLLRLLQERDQKIQEKLLKSAQRLSEIGIDKSLIFDTGTRTLEHFAFNMPHSQLP